MKKAALVVLTGLTAALLGGLVGALSAGFLHVIEWGQHLLWHSASASLPLQALIICTLGGLLIGGLCQRYLGDHPKNIADAVSELRETRRLDYKHLPQGMLTASTSLIFGASLGPEAAIMDLLGGLGTWVGDVIRSLRDRFELLPTAQPKNRLSKWLQRWPGLIAFAVGAFAFIRLLNGLYGGGLLDLSEPFQWDYLLWSVPLGLVGAVGGWLYLKIQTQTKNLLTPLEQKPILRGILGGFVLGLIALSLPMVLFSGQHFFQPMVDQAAQMGFWLLLLTALSRLFLTGLLLATGWKGGQFLPIMFGGAALGLAVSMAFPVVPVSVAVLAAMGALISVVLPKPLIALVLMALMFPLEYLGVSVISVGMVMIGKYVSEKARVTHSPEAGVVLTGD